jgi:hypothetical protein
VCLLNGAPATDVGRLASLWDVGQPHGACAQHKESVPCDREPPIPQPCGTERNLAFSRWGDRPKKATAGVAADTRPALCAPPGEISEEVAVKVGPKGGCLTPTRERCCKRCSSWAGRDLSCLSARQGRSEHGGRRVASHRVPSASWRDHWHQVRCKSGLRRAEVTTLCELTRRKAPSASSYSSAHESEWFGQAFENTRSREVGVPPARTG